MLTRYAPNLARLPAIDPDHPDAVTVVIETIEGEPHYIRFAPGRRRLPA